MIDWLFNKLGYVPRPSIELTILRLNETCKEARYEGENEAWQQIRRLARTGGSFCYEAPDGSEEYRIERIR